MIKNGFLYITTRGLGYYLCNYRLRSQTIYYVMYSYFGAVARLMDRMAIVQSLWHP
jgi:hypothetical protein